MMKPTRTPTASPIKICVVREIFFICDRLLDWGLGVGGWGLGIKVGCQLSLLVINWCSSLLPPNPQSPTPNSDYHFCIEHVAEIARDACNHRAYFDRIA